MGRRELHKERGEGGRREERRREKERDPGRERDLCRSSRVP